MLLAEVLEQLCLAGVLLVTTAAGVRHAQDVADRSRERRVRKRTVLVGDPASSGSRHRGAGVRLENVRLALGARLVDLLAVLAVEVALRPDDREVELGDRRDVDGRVSLGEVIHEHATALEPKLAVGALEDKLIVVGRGDLRHKLGGIRFRLYGTSASLGRRFFGIAGRMNSSHVIAQLVLQHSATTRCSNCCSYC